MIWVQNKSFSFFAFLKSFSVCQSTRYTDLRTLVNESINIYDIVKLNHGKPDETLVPVPNMEKISDDKQI